MSDSFVTPWTAAHQAPLSRGFPRQEDWKGLPFPSQDDEATPNEPFIMIQLGGSEESGAKS